MAAKRHNRELVLEALPGTPAQIMERTGLSAGTVSRWVTDLRNAGQAHIGKWTRTRGVFLSTIHAGPGRDAKKPKPLTSAQLTRNSRQRMRKSGEWTDRMAKDRARYWRKKAPKRDPLTAALFGAA